MDTLSEVTLSESHLFILSSNLDFFIEDLCKILDYDIVMIVIGFLKKMITPENIMTEVMDSVFSILNMNGKVDSASKNSKSVELSLSISSNKIKVYKSKYKGALKSRNVPSKIKNGLNALEKKHADIVRDISTASKILKITLSRLNDEKIRFTCAVSDLSVICYPGNIESFDLGKSDVFARIEYFIRPAELDQYGYLPMPTYEPSYYVQKIRTALYVEDVTARVDTCLFRGFY